MPWSDLACSGAHGQPEVFPTPPPRPVPPRARGEAATRAGRASGPRASGAADQPRNRSTGRFFSGPVDAGVGHRFRANPAPERSDRRPTRSPHSWEKLRRSVSDPLLVVRHERPGEPESVPPCVGPRLSPASPTASSAASATVRNPAPDRSASVETSREEGTTYHRSARSSSPSM